MVYSTRRFVLSLALCYFVLVFFSAFVRFALVLFCLFPFPLRVWDGLRLVIVALPGLFSYLFFTVCTCNIVRYAGLRLEFSIHYMIRTRLLVLDDTLSVR